MRKLCTWNRTRQPKYLRVSVMREQQSLMSLHAYGVGRKCASRGVYNCRGGAQ